MEVYVSATGFSEEQALVRHGLEGHTQVTASIRTDGSREPGAVVRIHTCMSPGELEPLWLDLRDKAGLECAHLVGAMLTRMRAAPVPDRTLPGSNSNSSYPTFPANTHSQPT
jgi:hypothetical protein